MYLLINVHFKITRDGERLTSGLWLLTFMKTILFVFQGFATIGVLDRANGLPQLMYNELRMAQIQCVQFSKSISWDEHKSLSPVAQSTYQHRWRVKSQALPGCITLRAVRLCLILTLILLELLVPIMHHSSSQFVDPNFLLWAEAKDVNGILELKKGQPSQ